MSKKVFKDSKYPVYEIVVGEEDDDGTGIRLVSLVDEPAIEIKGVALSKEKNIREVFFKKNGDKQIIVGPVLIPNKKILREDEDGNYYYNIFSSESIAKLVEKFNRRGDNRRINIDHTTKMVDAYIKESWIVEDTYYDKSKLYGFNVPKGTWMAIIKVEDEDFWQKEVKENEKFGFSIEGLLGEKPLQYREVKSLSNWIDDLDEEEMIEIFSEVAFADSYDDYPKAASENAKIALRWAEENGWGSCGTPVGKARANQLAKGEPISRDTISRMASFERHRANSTKELGDGCGRLVWLAWGGDEGIEWAGRKLKQIDNADEKEFVIEKEAGESKDDFLSRCISTEVDAGKPQDQAVAICIAYWQGEQKSEKEFKVVSGNTRTRNNIIKSSNLWKFKYDDIKQELTLRFQDGSFYTYFSVPPDIFESIRGGEGVCSTEGENEWGKWFIGKSPSVGAAIHEILIGGNFAYQKGGSI